MSDVSVVVPRIMQSKNQVSRKTPDAGDHSVLAFEDRADIKMHERGREVL